MRRSLPGRAEEVGMYNTLGFSSRAAMWWGDIAGGVNRRDRYRGDFASLINWLNAQRELRTPLRSGLFRTVLADEKRGILVAHQVKITSVGLSKYETKVVGNSIGRARLSDLSCATYMKRTALWRFNAQPPRC